MEPIPGVPGQLLHSHHFNYNFKLLFGFFNKNSEHICTGHAHHLPREIVGREEIKNPQRVVKYKRNASE